ncbi:MAG TPA: preprotein translocase subunit YajC [Longimicrobiales bacterium]
MNMFALALQAQRPAGQGLTIMLIYIVSFGLIAWLLLIRPQRKVQQRHQQMIAALKRGDEVMTEGGVIGTIVHIADDRVTLKSGENTRVVVARVKISRVFGGTETAG